jgi:hypothetical protein
LSGQSSGREEELRMKSVNEKFISEFKLDFGIRFLYHLRERVPSISSKHEVGLFEQVIPHLFGSCASPCRWLCSERKEVGRVTYANV